MGFHESLLSFRTVVMHLTCEKGDKIRTVKVTYHRDIDYIQIIRTLPTGICSTGIISRRLKYL